MRNLEGESDRGLLRAFFDRRLKFEFHGSRITSDAGLLAYRELDEALGLTTLAGDVIADSRTGKNDRQERLARHHRSPSPIRLWSSRRVRGRERRRPAGARSCDAVDRRRQGCRARRRIDQPDGPVRDGVTRHQ